MYNLSIQDINNFFTENFKEYNLLEQTISNNINGRICHHNVKILHILISMLPAGTIKNYLEIGVHNGASMSYVVHQSIPINCYGIDLFNNTKGHYSRDKLDIDRAYANIQNNNTSNSSIKLIQGNSLDTQIIDKIDTKEIDLLFIDGNHSYISVGKDFALFSTLLSKKAWIVFDDYNHRWSGIVKFCDSISEPNYRKIGVFNQNEFILYKEY